MEKEYFALRNINPDNNKNPQIPFYLKNRLKGKEVILDFGCGYGHLLVALKNGGFTNVYGYDINESAIKYCKRKKLTVFGNLTEIDTRFDTVVMAHVLEHIDKDKVIDTLQFIRSKLLREDGQLFVAVPNAQSNTGCYWRYEDWTHKTIFTAGSLLYVLKAAGFQKVEFMDIDNTANLNIIRKSLKKFFLKLFIFKTVFWNKVTTSAYHSESPNIFSYEIKAIASN